MAGFVLGFSISTQGFGAFRRRVISQLDSSSRQFPLSVSVCLKIKSAGRWALQEWTLTDVMLIRSSVARQMARSLESEMLYHWHDVAISIHKKSCESYYQNLRSNTPKLFVICRLDGNRIMQPIKITVDCDEATAYMEADETVFCHPMPEPVANWLQNFVVEFYCPETSRKRKRQDWKIGSKGESQA